jgi:hypothetical protein
MGKITTLSAQDYATYPIRKVLDRKSGAAGVATRG